MPIAPASRITAIIAIVFPYPFTLSPY
jgi:hypothetical protein